MVTPQTEYPGLTKAVGNGSLFLKREDLHPYGSHKGRSIPVMIDHYIGQGKRHFAISSSGNAALAAALYINDLNKGNENRVSRFSNDNEIIKLEILVGNKIPDKKLKELLDLADENISVLRFERPLQTLTQKTADGSIQSLRQSTDDAALVGYESLAKELEDIKDLQAIFLATSSGTTAQALAGYFTENGKFKVQNAKSRRYAEIHIVQTTSCHPLAEEFVDPIPNEDKSSADAIVDISAHRKDALIPLIKKTGGFGWIATNEEIKTAQGLIDKYANIKVSPNGALSVAGLMQAVLSEKEWDGAVACVIGGE